MADDNVSDAGSAAGSFLRSFAIVAVVGAVVLLSISGATGRDDDEPEKPSWLAAFSGTPTDNSARAADSPNRATHNVVYRVTITKNKRMSVTYRNGQGGTQQEDYKGESWTANTWTKGYSMRPGNFASISAQLGKEDGTITCQILVDGKTVRTSESRGPYKIASCSATVGRD